MMTNKGTSASPSSSSSVAVSGKQNPRSRNSEIGDPMRRSFGANPFANNNHKPSVIANPRGLYSNNSNPTPANSPSDFTRRNSIGRESILPRRDFEDKENEKDHIPNPARARSPAPPTPKSAKNFMSPTISAASKMNTLPKKKILAEKNDGARASVSFSDVRSLIMEEETKYQPSRSSVSFSSVVSIIGEDSDEPIPKVGLDQKNQLEVPHDMTITDLNDKEALVTDLDDKEGSGAAAYHKEAMDTNETVVTEEDSLNFDPTFKISPRCPDSCTYHTVAPLDADPLVPPYDPKTNYLSPRPQFLHYRPNPRIELYLNKGKQLEEIFVTESSSDTEVSEEETLLEDASQEGESAKEEEEKQEENEREENRGENEEVEEQIQKNMGKENAEANGASKPQRFGRWKFLGFIFCLAIAYFAVLATFSPAAEFSVIREAASFYDFYIPSEITELAKANLDQLGGKLKIWSEYSFEQLKIWSEDSISYITELLTRMGEVSELGPLQFNNLTDFSDDGEFDSVFPLSRGEDVITQLGQEEMEFVGNIEEDMEGEGHEPGYEEPVQQELGEETGFKVVSEEEDNSEPHEFHQDIVAGVIEHDDSDAKKLEGGDFDAEVEKIEDEVESVVDVEIEPENEADFNESAAKEGSEAKYKTNDMSLAAEFPALASEVLEESADNAENDLFPALASEVLEESADNAENDFINSELDAINAEVDLTPQVIELSTEAPEAENGICFEVESGEAETNPENTLPDVFSEELQSLIKKLLSTQIVLGFSLAVLGLLAVTSFFCTKNAKPIEDNASAAPEQPSVTKELDLENLIKEKLAAMNLHMTADTVGESCPSEMSSFQKSGSVYSKKGFKESSEAQSHERKATRRNNNNNRRESFASSASEYSTGSASYGSFTTYERIPIKSGHGEEEVITPVRRSSRLRNQVTVQ